MDDLQNLEEKKSSTLTQKLPDIIAFIASLGIVALAYLIVTNKIPKIYSWLYKHFYIVAIIGILGFLGEQVSVVLLVFILPLLLIGSTAAFTFKPEKYPIEEWWEIYALIVIFSTGFLVFLFYRWEQTKKLKGIDGKELKARVDPNEAARYKAEQARKERATRTLKLPGKESKETKTETIAEAADPNETPEQRMEREMKQLKEEFGRRSMKLTTTLIRIKNLAKSLDRDVIFNTIIEIINKGMDADRVQLLLNREKDRTLQVVRAEGMKPSEYKDLIIPHDENSIIGYIARQGYGGTTAEGGALGIKECEVDPKLRPLINQGKLKTILAAPIFVDEKLFAIINVEKMKNPDYTRDDQNLLGTCADVAGLVMKNAKLYAATMDDLLSTKKLSEEQLRKNEELKGSLSRIVSPSIAELIMANPASLKLGGNKCEVTVFFSDIRGFTKMSENMDPTEIVDQLNVYFTKMTDILMEFEGTLDKYVGDELMALFGAPVSRPDDPLRAVLCGLKMLEGLRELQEKWAKEGKPVIEIGIGINTGEVTAGYMGSEKQLSYTVIGDNVNLAARVMANAKPMQMLITRSTYERVKDCIDVEVLEPIMVKGKSKPVELFSVKGVKAGVNLEEILGSGKNLSTLVGSSNTTKPITPTVGRVSSAFADLGIDQTKQNIQIDDKPKVIECANCGTENDAQTKFCIKCGMPIF